MKVPWLHTDVMTMHGTLLTPSSPQYYPAVRNVHSLLVSVGNGLQYIVALSSQPSDQASLQTPAAAAHALYAEVHCAERKPGLTKLHAFALLSSSLQTVSRCCRNI